MISNIKKGNKLFHRKITGNSILFADFHFFQKCKNTELKKEIQDSSCIYIKFGCMPLSEATKWTSKEFDLNFLFSNFSIFWILQYTKYMNENQIRTNVFNIILLVQFIQWLCRIFDLLLGWIFVIFTPKTLYENEEHIYHPQNGYQYQICTKISWELYHIVTKYSKSCCLWKCNVNPNWIVSFTFFYFICSSIQRFPLKHFMLFSSEMELQLLDYSFHIFLFPFV